MDLLKKYAQAIDSSRPIYDVLLDDFEKGMTSSRLDEIFTEVMQKSVMNDAKCTSRGLQSCSAPSFQLSESWGNGCGVKDTCSGMSRKSREKALDVQG